MNINVKHVDIILILFKKFLIKNLLYVLNATRKKLKKLVTAAGFKLKGTGWYETDFKNNKAKTSKKSETKKTKP